MSSTEAHSFFTAAVKLKPGMAIAKDFASRKQADSFRVSLYKVRKYLENYTVDIAIDDKTVFATKARETSSYRIIDENGVVTNETVTLQTAYDKDLEELLQEAKQFSWKEELLQEAVTNLKARYGKEN